MKLIKIKETNSAIFNFTKNGFLNHKIQCERLTSLKPSKLEKVCTSLYKVQRVSIIQRQEAATIKVRNIFVIQSTCGKPRDVQCDHIRKEHGSSDSIV